jgi:hypothetical protein
MVEGVLEEGGLPFLSYSELLNEVEPGNGELFVGDQRRARDLEREPAEGEDKLALGVERRLDLQVVSVGGHGRGSLRRLRTLTVRQLTRKTRSGPNH